MPIISIIVPVYKVLPYLQTCVDSLRNQSFQDIEILLVDDGSPDECGALCDKFASEDQRIRVIHQKNAGLSCARNTGISAAKGEYICFVDSDDYVTPDYCQTLYDLLLNSSADFSVCRALRFLDGTMPTISNEAIVNSTVSNEDFLKMQVSKESEFGVWNKLFPRSIFHSIAFAPGKLNEDVLFSADLARLLHNGVAVTTRPCYLYRQRQGSIVSVQTAKTSPDLMEAGQYLVETAAVHFPHLLKECLTYAVSYPWSFVDKIYVSRSFSKNKVFLSVIRNYLRKYIDLYDQHKIYSDILRHRMRLFALSPILYAVNAYSRLLRVYLYHVINKDAYSDGHGI